MDLLEKLETDFNLLRESGAMDAALREWWEKHEELTRFGDLDGLVAVCRDGDPSDRGDADDVLAALCMEANVGDERAGVLLIWLLLPGLLIARSRLVRFGVLPLEDVTAEMMAGLWEESTAIARSDGKVAARLVNSSRWRALAAVREALGWANGTEPIDEDMLDAGAPVYGEAADAEPDGLAQAVRDGVLSPDQVELVLAGRREIVEITERLGIPLPTAQKRRLRARARLRAWAERAYRFPTEN